MFLFLFFRSFLFFFPVLFVYFSFKFIFLSPFFVNYLFSRSSQYQKKSTHLKMFWILKCIPFWKMFRRLTHCSHSKITANSYRAPKLYWTVSFFSLLGFYFYFSAFSCLFLRCFFCLFPFQVYFSFFLFFINEKVSKKFIVSEHFSKKIIVTEKMELFKNVQNFEI